MRIRWTILFCAVLAAPLVAATAEEVGVRLVYFSNLPDIDSRPGLPEAAGLVESLRAEGNEVHLIHGGDSLAPSTLAAFDRGAHMIALLNTLDPIAMAVAKREFAYGEDELSLRSYEAGFPMISNNLKDPATGGGLEGILESAKFRAGTRNVCMTGAVSMELQSSYMPKRVRTQDPTAATRRVASLLRDEGCDLIVALFGAVEPQQQDLLEDGLVDLVISAESHVQSAVVTESGTWVTVRASDPVAVIVDIGAGESPPCGVCSARIMPLDAAPPSEELQARITSYQAKLADILQVPVGTTKTELDTRVEALRTGESAFGNMVADALRTAANADVALINSGGIRGNRIYAADSVLTRGDIQRELPFRNSVVLLELTGAQLRAALENGLEGFAGQSGAFPQLSGLQARFDPLAAVGERVLDIRVNGTAIRDGQTYTMGTLDFLANGGDGYLALTQARPLRSSINALLWETVRGYVDARGEVAPVVEGRLINVRD